MDGLRMSSMTYRIATGRDAGRKVVTLQTLPRRRSAGGDAGKVGGYSLHAGVAAEAHESRKLESCAATSRARRSAEQRLSISPQGRVRYQLKTPWRNGTTHVEWDAVDFIAKLAALVPPPRASHPLPRLFAPNANLRAQLTPSGAAGGLRAMRRQWTSAPTTSRAAPSRSAPCDELGATAQAGLFHRHHHLRPLRRRGADRRQHRRPQGHSRHPRPPRNTARWSKRITGRSARPARRVMRRRPHSAGSQARVRSDAATTPQGCARPPVPGFGEKWLRTEPLRGPAMSKNPRMNPRSCPICAQSGACAAASYPPTRQKGG
ncbi:transposase (plasmid) [Serratia ureilytica]